MVLKTISQNILNERDDYFIYILSPIEDIMESCSETQQQIQEITKIKRNLNITTSIFSGTGTCPNKFVFLLEIDVKLKRQYFYFILEDR